jgi:hypothetical protein
LPRGGGQDLHGTQICCAAADPFPYAAKLGH